jgi:hypothetical protein
MRGLFGLASQPMNMSVRADERLEESVTDIFSKIINQIKNWQHKKILPINRYSYHIVV